MSNLYHLSWWQYAHTFLVHNLSALYYGMQFEFYKLFDTLEERLYVWRGKGAAGSYHLAKSVQIYRSSDELKGEQESSINPVEVWLAAKAYISLFGYRGKELDDAARYFHGGTYCRFLFARHSLMAVSLYTQIKDAATIVEMAEALDLTTARRAVHLFGQEGYKRLKTLSVKELFAELQREDHRAP